MVGDEGAVQHAPAIVAAMPRHLQLEDSAQLPSGWDGLRSWAQPGFCHDLLDAALTQTDGGGDLLRVEAGLVEARHIQAGEAQSVLAVGFRHDESFRPTHQVNDPVNFASPVVYAVPRRLNNA